MNSYLLPNANGIQVHKSVFDDPFCPVIDTTINWSSRGSVDIETAQQFLKQLEKAIELAKNKQMKNANERKKFIEKTNENWKKSRLKKRKQKD